MIISENEVKNKHLTLPERKIIQQNLLDGVPIGQIAKALGKHRSTIYKELSFRENYDYVRIRKKVKKIYVAKLAQANYQKRRKNSGPKYKIFKDDNLVKYLEDNIGDVKKGKMSVDVAIGRAKYLGLKFKVSVTMQTVYNYIHRGQLKISKFDLPYILSRKPNEKKDENKKKNKTKLGESIENRPENVNDRSEFGHWEGDCVVDKDNNAILNIFERQKRMMFIFKLKKHNSENVLKALNKFINSFGKIRYKVFKTITFDNGTEFYRVTELENKNLKMYFTHPYSSWEKGGIENSNGIIRRYIPKGKDIGIIKQEKLDRVANQINNTPRKILGYRTPRECFEEALQSIVA